MATRDKTSLFLSYRDSHSKPTIKSNEYELLVTKENALAPLWQDQVDAIEHELHQLSQEVQYVLSQYKSTLPTFEKSSYDASPITKSFAQIAHHIKQISVDNEPMKRNIQMGLTNKLQALSNIFCTAQRDYMQRMRELEKRGHENAIAIDVQMEFNMGSVTQHPQQQQQFQNNQAIDTHVNQINDIVQSISQLAEIFRELQTMVVDQGTVLDRIDYNIETAGQHVHEANVELDKANTYQKNSKAKLCLIILCLVVVVLIILLFLKKK